MQGQDLCLFCIDLPATVEAYPCSHLLCDRICLKSYVMPVGLCMRCPICKTPVSEYRDHKTKKIVVDITPLHQCSDHSLAKWQKLWIDFNKARIQGECQQETPRPRTLLEEQNLEILKGMCEYRPSDDEEDDEEDDDDEEDQVELQKELMDLIS